LPIPGPGHDFADGAHLLTVTGADWQLRKLVGAGQKSGIYWMVDATTGEIVWSAALAPGSEVGGIHRRRTGVPGGDQLRQGGVRAAGRRGDRLRLDRHTRHVATGAVVWSVGEPHEGLDQGAVSVPNGVLYAGSLNGYRFAIDADRSGTRGEGSSNAGPAIVGGSVYWGNGYERAGIGTPSRTFYAVSLPNGRW
jgi:polyvinyl alcohol dehydrogenase (cytochrome)